MTANEKASKEIERRIEQLREATSLSDQEAKIQAYSERGFSPSEIAKKLDISRSQVSVALDRISQKQQKAAEMSNVMSGEHSDRDRNDGGILPENARPRDNPQIFLAPCVNEKAQQHFRAAVIDKVDVDSETYRSLVPSRYQERVAIWGTGEGNSPTAKAMETGDVILFYVGENTYSHYAIVKGVERNPELAEALWTPYGDTIRKDEKANWPWVMYLSDPVEIDIDSERLHDIFGWNQSFPMGFTRIADHRITRLQNEHGSVQQYLEEMLVKHAAKGDGAIPTINMSMEPEVDESEGSETDKRSLQQLRERAEERAQETTTSTTTTTTQYSRSTAIKNYVLARASGVCEACGKPAPFEKPDGQPYLEAHHVFKVSDEGMDDPDAVAAICPTCHRRIHHGRDGNEYNKQLIETLRNQRNNE